MLELGGELDDEDGVLAASPISTTKPTWVRMLLSWPRSTTPLIAATRHMGTIRITASGSVRLELRRQHQEHEHHGQHEGEHRGASARSCWNASVVHRSQSRREAFWLQSRCMVSIARPWL